MGKETVKLCLIVFFVAIGARLILQGMKTLQMQEQFYRLAVERAQNIIGRNKN